MLLDLHIRDFILISELHLSWEQGLTVLTGETGAGKSIIIDALAILLGGKVSAADIVRTGSDSALIEATFTPTADVLALLSELGISTNDADACLLIGREISRNGRSKCRVNGQLATVSVLQRIGNLLIDIHSQHESQWLLSSSRQLDMLDAFGGSCLAALRGRVSDCARRRSTARREYDLLLAGERDRVRQLDILRYQVDEIAAASLVDAEDEGLEEERVILANAEHLSNQLQLAYQALYENESGAAVDLLGTAIANLTDAAKLDAKCREFYLALREIEAIITDNSREIRRRQEEMQANPERLSFIEARLELIDKLKRKYGRNVTEVLQYAEQAESEITKLAAGENRTSELATVISQADHDYITLATELHQMRLDIAENLMAKVEAELKHLGMERALFRIVLDEKRSETGVDFQGTLLAATERGYDDCEFTFSANPGEEPRPLARVASGGELSRVMLALKTVLASVYDVPTLIFDEVDAGLGGRTAQAVAQKLRILADSRQVLCVTHLAQIAAAATQHIKIDKVVTGDTTSVSLCLLSTQERIYELARMLDGTESPTTLEHAREMLASTQKGPS